MSRRFLIPILSLVFLGAAASSIRSRRAHVGLEAATLRLEPAGADMGSLKPGLDLEIIADQGDWSQVRITGWVYRPALRDSGRPSPSRALRPSETPFVPGGNPAATPRPFAPIPPVGPEYTATP